MTRTIDYSVSAPRSGQRDESRPWALAWFWAVALSVYFFAVYGGCLWITSLHEHVPTFHFAWEKHIPFIPAMIVPYWSIDLFFFLSMFLCSNRNELAAHARRILLAITLAGACFILLPLQMGFTRPPVDGVFGWLFNALSSFDKPYNLFPSLHIALWLLLLVIYDRHTRGAVNVITRAWFILIPISTLLTYQHHIIDVAGGLLLGMLCLYIFPIAHENDAPAERLPRQLRNIKFGLRYLATSILFAAVAVISWPWGVVLFWPAFSTAVLASAYFHLGPRIFRKQSGRIPAMTWIFLAPYLISARLANFCYRRNCTTHAEVAPGLRIGRLLTGREAEAMIQQGVTAVLDLSAEFTETAPFRRLSYHNIQILDFTPPTVAQLRESVRFIEHHLSGGRVYVHCALGYSRSACVAAAYLLHSGAAATAEDAIEQIKSVRPQIRIDSRMRTMIDAFGKTIGEMGEQRASAAAVKEEEHERGLPSPPVTVRATPPVLPSAHAAG